jgi:hypothetical protein
MKRARTLSLEAFRGGIPDLTLKQRATIVQQAIMCLESFHVNLPLKCAMYAVDPLRRLRLLQQRLRTVFTTDALFHREMTQIFNSLNDLHTNYFLPEPYSSHSAWLPFAIEFCERKGQSTYLATKVRRNWASARGFREGVEILSWNGVPMRRAVELFAAQSPSGAGNAAARHALGLYTLTQRPLRILLPPDEEWVVVGYRSLRGEKREIRVPWRVSGETDAAINRAPRVPAGRVQELRRRLFSGKSTGAAQSQPVDTSSGTMGYLRIFTFEVDDTDQFIEDVVAQIARLPERGLIVDVRGNGGGRTAAAERLLQLFAPEAPIEPARLALINTPRMLQFCRLGANDPGLGFQGLKPWIESVERAMETGAPYSAAFSITDPAAANELRAKRYPGPVIVVTDGLSRSAAEVFSAGFQDHGGQVLSVDQSTGGAGAGVRRHSEFKAFFADAKDNPFVDLPRSVDFSVPFRRFQRVRTSIGREIEDFGVVSRLSYRMTADDILHHNVRLINEAAKHLAALGRKGRKRMSAAQESTKRRRRHTPA